MRSTSRRYLSGRRAKWKAAGMNVIVAEKLWREIKQCEICGSKPGGGLDLHVDHDHKRNRVRGILCLQCNIRFEWFIRHGTKIERYKEKTRNGRIF